MKTYRKPEFITKEHIFHEVVNACSNEFNCPKAMFKNSCDTDPSSGYCFDPNCETCPNKEFKCGFYWECKNSRR